VSCIILDNLERKLIEVRRERKLIEVRRQTVYFINCQKSDNFDLNYQLFKLTQSDL